MLQLQRALKRLVDISVALTLLVLTAPIMLVSYLAIRLSMGAPALFVQQRPGKNEEPFFIYKFRTMRTQKPGQGLSDHERMTGVGRFLRRTSIDELPQLLNVLKGELSLVGPRPLLMEYLPRYNQTQRRRHDVTPGITGWAQVNGRNNTTWDQRFAHDVWYVDHWSLWLDFKILFLTAYKVLSSKDVNASETTTMTAFTGNSDKIPLSIPHLNGNELQYVREALDSNWVAPLGPFVDRFEGELAKKIQRSHVIAMSSGTAAIHIALRLLDVKAGDTVFCQSLTFVATANPILYQGATPVFIDSNPDDWNISVPALRRALAAAKAQGRLPKAVIAVDLFGQPADYDQIVPLCKEYAVPLIEDAAEALGSTYKGKPCGSFGDFGILSFNGNKIITTSGGGALGVNDPALAKKAKFLITQARDAETWYEHSEAGYNYRMSNILAAIGCAQLETLAQRVEARRQISLAYAKAFAGAPLQMMPALDGRMSNNWLSAAVLTGARADGKTANELIHSMLKEGIELRHIWKPLHLQPLFKDAKYYPHDHDVAAHLFANGMCLPSWSGMLEKSQLQAITKLSSWLST